MSNIEQYLADILAARYGEEVRQSIHDAIEQCYEDGRAGAIDLEARADIAAETTAREALDTRVETLENDTTTAEEVTYDDTDTQLGATDVQGAIGALNDNLANKLNVSTTSGTFTGNIDDIKSVWDVQWFFGGNVSGTPPTTTGYFVLITIRSVQIAIGPSTTVAFYRRIYTNGAWAAWVRVNAD